MMLAGGIARNKTIEGVLINIFLREKNDSHKGRSYKWSNGKEELYKKLRIQRAWNPRVLLPN